jgi:hypothetical protein
MTSTCDSVTERIALGEPLDELGEHIASCSRCQRTVEVPGKLAATHRDVDPGLGFAARMTVGAQHRLVVRRRRRVAAAMGGTVAAGVMGIVLFTRTSSEVPSTAGGSEVHPSLEAPDDLAIEPAVDPDVKALVRLADTRRSSRLSADWGRITKPLAAYRKLVKGVKP